MVHLMVAALLAGLGYLVKYRQWTWLISGYNLMPKAKRERYNTAALCRATGNLMFAFAGMVLIAAAGELLGIDGLVGAGWLLFMVVAVAALIYMNTGRRYLKS